MSNHTPTEQNIAEFRRRFEMNHQIMAPMIQGFQKEATEYAKIIFRQLFLLNGGALVLVPTLFSSIGSQDPLMTLWAARFFVAGLVFVLVATYVSHLNFLFIATALQDEENSRVEIWRAELLEGEKVGGVDSLKQSRDWRILTTFIISHVAGVLSVSSLVIGAWKIMGAVQ